MPCDAPAAAPPRPTAQSSPLRVRCVVKLGGAACTAKAGVNELDGGALDAAARQLALGAARFPPPSPVPFVVVHGAGSFGHPQVRGARLKPNSSDSGRAFYMATLDVLSTTECNSMCLACRHRRRQRRRRDMVVRAQEAPP